MSLTRIAGAILTAVVLALSALGYYVYRAYPENLEAVLVEQLAPYGITSLDIDALRLGTRALTFEGLVLGGSSAAQRYSVTLQGLTIGYHWRDLLEQRVDQIAIESAIVTLAPGSQTDTRAPDDITLSDFLPQELLTLLPLRELRIEHWQLSYPTPWGALALSGNLEATPETLAVSGKTRLLDAEFDVHVACRDDRPLAVKLTMDHEKTRLSHWNLALLETSENEWRWTISSDIRYASLQAWLASDTVESALPALQWPARLQLVGMSELTGHVSHPAIITTAQQSAPATLPLNVALDANHRIETFAQADIVRASDVLLATKVTLNDKAAAIEIAPGKMDSTIDRGMAATAEQGKTLGWRERVPLSLSWREPLIATWQRDANALNIKAPLTTFNLGNSTTRLVLETDDISLSYPLMSDDRLAARAEGTMRTRLRRKALPALRYAINLDGPMAENRITASLDDTAESMHLKVQSLLDLYSGSGNTRLEFETRDLPFAAGTLIDLLTQFDLLEEPVTISRGTLTLSSEVNTTTFGLDGLSQTTQLTASGIAGKLGEYTFDGLNASLAFKGLEQVQTIEPALISIESFDAGFVVSDISASFSLPTPTPVAKPNVTLERFSANVFDGSIALTEPTAWQVGAKSNALSVRAQNWDLRALVALQQGEDIEAAGRLEGKLPVQVEDGRVIIEGGFLRAIPPGGNIRYQATDRTAQVAASNEQLGMALDLLEDFRFKVLSTEVALDKAGNLVLGLALSGSNPQQFDGRQINFNINVDQNIDPLLQSLRLGDAIVKKLENKAR